MFLIVLFIKPVSIIICFHFFPALFFSVSCHCSGLVFSGWDLVSEKLCKTDVIPYKHKMCLQIKIGITLSIAEVILA